MLICKLQKLTTVNLLQRDLLHAKQGVGRSQEPRSLTWNFQPPHTPSSQPLLPPDLARWSTDPVYPVSPPVWAPRDRITPRGPERGTHEALRHVCLSANPLRPLRISGCPPPAPQPCCLFFHRAQKAHRPTGSPVSQTLSGGLMRALQSS